MPLVFLSCSNIRMRFLALLEGNYINIENKHAVSWEVGEESSLSTSDTIDVIDTVEEFELKKHH